MPEIRQQDHWYMTALVASEEIDISEYDKVGMLTTDGQAALCSADQTPQFLFCASAEAGQPVRCAFFQLASGQVKVALSGSGGKGNKLSVGSGGKIVASNTAEDAEADEDDIGVALGDWSDKGETEVLFIQGRKV